MGTESGGLDLEEKGRVGYYPYYYYFYYYYYYYHRYQ